MDDQVVTISRGDLLEICIGTAFLVVGLASCANAALRRHRGVRIFLWIGIWSAAYGLMHVLAVPAVDAVLPHSLQVVSPLVITAIGYSLVVVASLAWLELIVGAVRRLVIALVIAASITAVLGIGWFVATGDSQQFMALNNLLAAGLLIGLLTVLLRKRLFSRFLLLPNRGFLVFGTLVFAVEALFVNLLRPLFGFHSHPVLLDHLGFLVLLTAFGYSGLKMVVANEHRLLEIDTELEVARQIQASILPAKVPEVSGLRICTTYKPMKSVAGDFYEFLPVDQDRAGFLVADVCGHGVPAALIASMLKVAVRSVAECADHPGQFLAALNRVLAEPLNGQLVSASYLWVDMRTRTALYSAAGHPPLLRCNEVIEAIESNGLLFGIMRDAEYPVTHLPLCKGDRLLLYTDGVIEPENNEGLAFGDGQLQRVLAETRAEDASAVSGRIVSEIRKWQGTTEPQDDVTFVILDVVEG